MSRDTIVEEIVTTCGLTDAKRQVVADSADRYCLWLLNLVEWKFRRSEHTQQSTSGVNEYTLVGANDDCAQVQQLFFDSVPLDYLDPKPFEREAVPVLTPTTVEVRKWTVKGMSAQGFPVATLLGTPTSTKNIYYSYLKKIDPVDPTSSLEPSMEDIVITRMLSRYHPDGSVRQINAQENVLAIDGAIATYGMKSLAPRKPRIDEYRRMRNREISLHSGYTNSFAGRLIDPS